jgi:hypothetical protein
MVTFAIEIDRVEKGLLTKVLNSFLAELRQEIAATKRDTADLHAEELAVKRLLAKLAEAA